MEILFAIMDSMSKANFILSQLASNKRKNYCSDRLYKTHTFAYIFTERKFSCRYDILIIFPADGCDLHKKGYPRYRTKVLVMSKLRFSRSEECGVPLSCYYSQVHSDLKWYNH